jgi:hypothetical protein
LLSQKSAKILLFLKNIKICNQQRFEMTYAGARCGAGRGCGDLTRPPVLPAPARSPGWREASSGTHQYAFINSSQRSFEKQYFLFMRCKKNVDGCAINGHSFNGLYFYKNSLKHFF